MKSWIRNNLLSYRMAPLLAVGVAIAAIVLLAVAFGSHMQLNSKRSEARIMLAYLHTLQRGYYLEEGRYVFFSQYYGASISGNTQCERPKAATELGFILRACERGLMKDELRYAYAVLSGGGPEDQGYQAVAFSGSDVNGISKVCGKASSVDRWTIDQNRQIEHTHACVPHDLGLISGSLVSDSQFVIR